jgi:hypothetical protein
MQVKGQSQRCDQRQNYATAVNTGVNMATSAPRSNTGKPETHAKRAESGTFRLKLVWNASCYFVVRRDTTARSWKRSPQRSRRCEVRGYLEERECVGGCSGTCVSDFLKPLLRSSALMAGISNSNGATIQAQSLLVNKGAKK